MNRRSFLTGLIAAPSIVRPHLLMPIKPQVLFETKAGFIHYVSDDFGALYADELSDYLLKHCEFLDTPFVRLAGQEPTLPGPLIPLTV
jgi:hypothetical protein